MTYPVIPDYWWCRNCLRYDFGDTLKVDEVVKVMPTDECRHLAHQTIWNISH